jgi:thiamine-monophosphate kinase
VNEYEIIEAIVGAAGRLPRGYSRIGDDVGKIPLKKGKLIVKTDMLVAKSDVPRGMTYREVARKSVGMCVSDFASKGVLPDSYLISLGLREGTTREQVKELALGFADASSEWRVKLVGGDTSEAEDLVINCAMFGFAKRIVPRSGAKPGQMVVTTGYFGYPPSGLKILLEGATAERKFRELAVQSVRRPRPNLPLGVGISGFLSAAMDSSDGLAISLHTLARSSGVGMNVTKLPAKKDVESFASSNGYNATDLALYGGEEYIIVGTMDSRRYDEARGVAENLGGELIAIGETTRAKGRVLLETEGKERKEIEMRGWIHTV